MHFKLLHQKTGKISKSWVHANRLKPADPRPIIDLQYNNNTNTEHEIYIHKELKPHPIVQNEYISALHLSANTNPTRMGGHNEPSGVETPNHFEIPKEKPIKACRVLAKKLNQQNEWLYRICFIGLDHSHNQWVAYHDLPQCLKTLVTVGSKKIKSRQTNKAADKL